MTLNPRTELQVVDRIWREILNESRPGDSPEPQPPDLSALAEAYRAAGRYALAGWTGDPREWLYWRLATASDHTHDALLRHRLFPLLTGLTEAGAVDNWWFLRKPHGEPHLRLRVHPTTSADLAQLTALLDSCFEDWRQERALLRASRLVYEPEVSSFGGATGMALAHKLFHRDSLGYCTNAPALSARGFEFAASISATLVAGCFQGAGLDWFEQGDVWRVVSLLRAEPPQAGGTEVDTKAVARLRSIFAGTGAAVAETETEAASDVPELTGWHLAFQELGHALAEADARGELEIGIRRILALHVVFHWNRMGFDLAQQAQLALTARRATSWAA